MTEPYQLHDPFAALPRELEAPDWQKQLLADGKPTQHDVGGLIGAIRGITPQLGLPRFDLDKLDGDPPLDRAWILPGFIPENEVTLFTGPGGAGKSLFAQQLATCIAARRPFLGMETVEYPDDDTNAIAYITAEDDERELHRRQRAIMAAIGANRADLGDRLYLSSLRGRIGNELATFNHEGEIEKTRTFELLGETIEESGAMVVILDNVAHLFCGNENDRGQATKFVNLLYSLVRRWGITVVLLGHPNKSGDDYSGSTAWRNAVRSQINLERLTGDAAEHDPDARVLSVSKANYSRAGETLNFRWHRGAFVRDEDLPADYAAELAESIRVQGENETFLRCLRARMEQPGREVGPSMGANYAPARFAEMTEAKGLPKAKLARAMERLLHVGKIKTEVVKRKGSDTKTIIVEVS